MTRRRFGHAPGTGAGLTTPVRSPWCEPLGNASGPGGTVPRRPAPGAASPFSARGAGPVKRVVRAGSGPATRRSPYGSPSPPTAPAGFETRRPWTRRPTGSVRPGRVAGVPNEREGLTTCGCASASHRPRGTSAASTRPTPCCRSCRPSGRTTTTAPEPSSPASIAWARRPSPPSPRVQAALARPHRYGQRRTGSVALGLGIQDTCRNITARLRAHPLQPRTCP